MSALAGAPRNRRGQVLAGRQRVGGLEPHLGQQGHLSGDRTGDVGARQHRRSPPGPCTGCWGRTARQDETRKMTFLSMAPARCALRQAVAERGDDLAFPRGQAGRVRGWRRDGNGGAKSMRARRAGVAIWAHSGAAASRRAAWSGYRSTPVASRRLRRVSRAAAPGAGRSRQGTGRPGRWLRRPAGGRATQPVKATWSAAMRWISSGNEALAEPLARAMRGWADQRLLRNGAGG
jgi:hypothetical protein